MWIGYASRWHWLEPIETCWLGAAHTSAIGRPGWVTAWDVVCIAFSPTTFRLLALAGIVAALIRRNVRVAMFLLLSVELSGLVTEIAKRAANRPRPDTALVF